MKIKKCLDCGEQMIMELDIEVAKKMGLTDSEIDKQKLKFEMQGYKVEFK